MEQLIKSTYKRWQEAKKYASRRCRKTLPELARQLDNCTMFTGEETLPELISLIFEPQGREFILANHFPSLNLFRKFKQFNPEQYGVFIDSGNITLNDPGKIYLVGQVNADIYCRQTQANNIILMHGAKAKIYASGYSVIKAENDRKSEIQITASPTAKVL